MIKDKLEQILINIENNALYPVEIIAATKQQTLESIEYLNELSKDIVMAENRVQEFIAKYNENRAIIWDFIGRLQSNKVKFLVGKIRYIQSVDKESLLKTIDCLSKKNNLIQKCFVQINAGNESNKGGISFDETEEFLEKALIYKNLKMEGLMIVTPFESDEGVLSKYFVKARETFDLFKDRYGLKYLSMGMSNDYILALKCGSNMIRLGTALFGPRNIYIH
ncbi:MAG: YggS family pyridoxal phosphate-dependent enzyme [Christensenellales bacterium]|jgi:pyridoxal phosphate enzyme (YggS family)|nr:YggS family pyridoxal phosphate-dependent enzyme [Clostridiales bacterium]